MKNAEVLLLKFASLGKCLMIIGLRVSEDKAHTKQDNCFNRESYQHDSCQYVL